MSYEEQVSEAVLTPDMLKWSDQKILTHDTAKRIAREADAETRRLRTALELREGDLSRERFDSDALRNDLHSVRTRIAALEAENAKLREALWNAGQDIRWKLQSRVDGLLTANQLQDIAAIAGRIEKELENQNEPT